jgi:CBS domain-containing protein
MTQDVFTVAPGTSLKEASAIFLARRVSGVPVVDGGRLVGVLSESDIVAKETSDYIEGEVSRAEALHLQREHQAETAGEAMTPDPVTVEPWMSVWAAADLMTIHGVNRLPVVGPTGDLVGIVTRDDLVRAFARSDDDLEREIRGQQLPSAGVHPNDLDVRVERGVVTVTGSLESDAAREALHRSLRLVPGVVRVDWHVEKTPGVT